LKSALSSRCLPIGKRRHLPTRMLPFWLWLMLRLVEVCRRLDILIHTGIVREVPVIGRIGNEIVFGSVVCPNARYCHSMLTIRMNSGKPVCPTAPEAPLARLAPPKGRTTSMLLQTTANTAATLYPLVPITRQKSLKLPSTKTYSMACFWPSLQMPTSPMALNSQLCSRGYAIDYPWTPMKHSPTSTSPTLSSLRRLRQIPLPRFPKASPLRGISETWSMCWEILCPS
jgi:hypothetical protein